MPSSSTVVRKGLAWDRISICDLRYFIFETGQGGVTCMVREYNVAFISGQCVPCRDSQPNIAIIIAWQRWLRLVQLQHGLMWVFNCIT